MVKRVIIILAVFTILAAAGYYYFAPAANGPEEATIAEDIMEDNTGMEDGADTSNWKTYRNEEYGFEFRYPENYDIMESNNEIVVTFPSGEKSAFNLSVTNSFEEYRYPSEFFKKLLYENGEWRYEDEFGSTTMEDVFIGKTKDGNEIFKLCYADAGATRCDYVIPLNPPRQVVSLVTDWSDEAVTVLLKEIEIILVSF